MLLIFSVFALDLPACCPTAKLHTGYEPLDRVTTPLVKETDFTLRLGLILRKIHIPELSRMAKEAVLETVTMSYGDDGILRIKIKEGAVMGLPQAKLQFETIRRVCGDGKILVLIDATASHTVTKEAQEYAAQNVGNRIATAVINPNPFSKISLNIFLKIFRPATPFRMFSNEENAVSWLNEQKANLHID